MIGDNLWCVTWQGQILKRDLSRDEAEAFAEKRQRGLCKHRDMGDHIEIKRDKAFIKDVDEMWKTAKKGERQVYKQLEWRGPT